MSVQEAAAAAAEVEESTGRDTTPRRKRLREAAAQSQTKQARGMQKRAAHSDGGPLKVGAVVQVAVDEVDRGKVDDSNATLVVVELVVTGIKRKETKYRLAGLTGTVNTLYSRSYVKPLKHATPALVGLDRALQNWQGLPQVSK